MKLQEFLNKLSLASCPHGRTRGPYVQLCQHLEKLHAEIQKNPHFADALAKELLLESREAREKHYDILKQESAKAFDAPTK